MDFVETLQRLVELQKTDSGLDELERMKKNFLQEAATLDANVTALKSKIQEEKKNLEDLLKHRKTLEIEMGTLDTKVSNYLGQQNEVKSNEQFAALKMEIEKSKEEKGKIEEKVLECLFKEDEQKVKMQGLTAQLAQAEKKATEDKKELQQKVTDSDKEAQDKKEERKKQFSELPQEFAEGYDSLRTHGKKVAVAGISEEKTCEGCNMNVSPQILNEIRKNIAIQRCNCGRYLYLKD